MPVSVKNAIRYVSKLSGFHENAGIAAKKRLYDFYCQFIKNDDLVFDIGANVGDYTEAFVKSGAKVICIEPNPDCVKILKQRFGNNKNVIIVGKAVGDKNGCANCYIGENPLITTLDKNFKELVKKKKYIDNTKYKKTIKTKVITLDSLIKKYGIPKYCKIDTEGFEKQVFSGLSYKIPYLSYEFYKNNLGNAKFCAKKILSFGNALFSYGPAFRKSIWNGPFVEFDKLFNDIEIKHKEYGGDIFVKYISK